MYICEAATCIRDSSDLYMQQQCPRLATAPPFHPFLIGRDFIEQPHVSSVEEFDAYIIVSFVNATLVLSIGETVEEVTDSGFLGTTPTLSCSQLGDDALVQVAPSILASSVAVIVVAVIVVVVMIMVGIFILLLLVSVKIQI